MDSLEPPLPKISDEDRTPLIDVLLELLAWQQQQIDKLEQEILKLKGETTKPKIKPSKMDDDNSGQDDDGKDDNSDTTKKNKGLKRKKTQNLKIDVTVEIEPNNIPQGSVFKGHRDVVIQNIKFETFNTCYRLAQYQTPDGSYVSGQLPEGLDGCHFGKDLIGFILYQYHHQHVTQPLLLKQLQDLGVDISSGRLSQFTCALWVLLTVWMCSMMKKTKYSKPDCPYRSISILMTPVRVMMAKMAIAPISAMNCLPGLAVPKVKAALISLAV
ncbi:MAG: hypothetical protein Q8S52_05185 [Methylobacter sp.]|nr:hypothetical protein [Methylobacter sp.]